MKWSESHSVVSNSLWPRGVVHGILQERILEWVTFPFSWRSSQPRDGTQLSHIAGRFFTSWAIRLIKMLTEFQCDLIPGSWVWDVSFAVSITVLAQVLSFHILFFDCFILFQVLRNNWFRHWRINSSYFIILNQIMASIPEQAK